MLELMLIINLFNIKINLQINKNKTKTKDKDKCQKKFKKHLQLLKGTLTLKHIRTCLHLNINK